MRFVIVGLRPAATVLAQAIALGLACTAIAHAYEPKMNYTLQCMGCHTPDGSGVEGRVPSFRDTLGPFSRLPEGRRFLVQVPGSAQSALSNAELAALLNWMIGNLSNADQKGRFTPFTEGEVASYRKTPLIQMKEAREELVRATASR